MTGEMQQADEAAAQAANMQTQQSAPTPVAPTAEDVLSGLDSENRALFESLPQEKQSEMMQAAIQGMGGAQNASV